MKFTSFANETINEFIDAVGTMLLGALCVWLVTTFIGQPAEHFLFGKSLLSNNVDSRDFVYQIEFLKGFSPLLMFAAFMTIAVSIIFIAICYAVGFFARALFSEAKSLMGRRPSESEVVNTDPP